MKEIEKRIEELEQKAAESALIANLSPSREIRIVNARLADELRQLAGQLKSLQPEPPWAL